MKKLHKNLSLLAVSALTLIGFAACEKKTPAEEAGEEVGEAIEEVGDAVKDATN